MKKTLIFLGILVLLWLGASFMAGGMAQDQYMAFLQEHARGPLTLTNVQYDRGLFSSTALTRVALTNAEEEGEEFAMLLKHVVRHGPLPLGATDGMRPALAQVETLLADVSLQPDATRKLLTTVPALEQAQAVTWIGFQGQADCVVQIPAVATANSEKNSSFTASACIMRFQYNPSQQALDGDLDFPELQIQDQDEVVSLHGLRGQFDLVETLPWLYVGRVTTVFDRMDVKASNSSSFSLNGLHFISDSGIQNDRLFCLQNATLDSLLAGEKTYGPIVFDTALRNVDAKNISEFQGRMRSMYGQQGSTEEIEARLNALLEEFFSKILAGNPELEISRFSLRTDEGDLEGKLNVRLTGSGSVAVMNPLLLLPRLEIRGEVSAKETLVRYAVEQAFASELKGAQEGVTIDQYYEAQIGPLLEQELLVRDGDRLKSSGALIQGRLSVNGKEMPLF